MEKRGWNEDEEGALEFHWKGHIKAQEEFWSGRGVTALSPRQREILCLVSPMFFSFSLFLNSTGLLKFTPNMEIMTEII